MAKLESCPAVCVDFFLKEALPLPGFRVDGIRSLRNGGRVIRYKINPHNDLTSEKIRKYIRGDFKEIDFGNIIDIEIDVRVVTILVTRKVLWLESEPEVSDTMGGDLEATGQSG